MFNYFSIVWTEWVISKVILFIDRTLFSSSHLFVPSFFGLSSFGSLYFVTQHAKLPWCFHWEGSLMERNVCSLSTIGMQALYQCMWFACQLFHFSTVCLFVSFLSIVCSVVSPYYIFSVFLPLMHMGIAGLSLAHGLNFSLVYKFITCSIIFFSAEFWSTLYSYFHLEYLLFFGFSGDLRF